MALQSVNSLTSPRAGVLAPVTSARFDLPRYERSLVTQRSIQTTEEAFSLVYEPPATHQRVAWMGVGKANMAVASSSFDYRQDAKMRADARERRARTMREMRSFLDDVEETIRGASQATAGRPRAVPPTASPSRAQTARVSGGSATSTTKANSASTTGGNTNNRRAGSVTPTKKAIAAKSAATAASAPQGQTDTLAASLELAASNERERLAAGDLIVSAFDGTIHEVYEITAYNAFVHDRMLEIVRDEEAREAEGEVFSCSSSIQMNSPSHASQSRDMSTSQQQTTSPLLQPTGGGMKHSARRPASLPDVDSWNRLPSDVDEQGKPLEESTFNAARANYNNDASANAKSLMAFRVFRTRRFEREFAELQRGSN